MSTVIIGALAAIAAVIGSFVTWKISKRNTSGSIDTSEASDLWAEGSQLRAELRTELTETKAALHTAAEAITELKDEIRLSREETHGARTEALELRIHIAALTEQITELHKTQMEALKEVKTGNTLTLAGLADNAETRRIMEIPKKDRTNTEQGHLDTALERLSVDQAADQTDDKEAS